MMEKYFNQNNNVSFKDLVYLSLFGLQLYSSHLLREKIDALCKALDGFEKAPVPNAPQNIPVLPSNIPTGGSGDDLFWFKAFEYAAYGVAGITCIIVTIFLIQKAKSSFDDSSIGQGVYLLNDTLKAVIKFTRGLSEFFISAEKKLPDGSVSLDSISQSALQNMSRVDTFPHTQILPRTNLELFKLGNNEGSILIQPVTDGTQRHIGLVESTTNNLVTNSNAQVISEHDMNNIISAVNGMIE